jgi:Holliday junction resolvase RusA-like endonuclease
MKFTILLSPKAQKRARSRAFLIGGKAIAGKPYTDNDQRTEQNKLMALMYPHKPPIPFQGAIILGVKVYLPIPKGLSKKKHQMALDGAIRPTTKPDLDNLIKQIKDVCKGVFWVDDKQVVEYLPFTGKWYGDPARWEIEIDDLP